MIQQKENEKCFSFLGGIKRFPSDVIGWRQYVFANTPNEMTKRNTRLQKRPVQRSITHHSIFSRNFRLCTRFFFDAVIIHGGWVLGHYCVVRACWRGWEFGERQICNYINQKLRWGRLFRVWPRFNQNFLKLSKSFIKLNKELREKTQNRSDSSSDWTKVWVDSAS